MKVARRVLIKLRSIVDVASTTGAVLAGLLMVTMMLATVADIARRGVQDRGIPGVIEGSEIALVVLIYLGLAYAQQTNAHVSMDLVRRRLPDGLGGILEAIGLVVVAAIITWIAYETSGRAVESVRSGEFRFGQISIPVWPARVMIPIGLYLLAAQLFYTAAQRAGFLPPRPGTPGPAPAPGDTAT